MLSQADEAAPLESIHVLIVEDNEADVFLIKEAILATKLPLSLHIARNGEQAIVYFEHADVTEEPSPVLVILDINLPRKPGYEVLKQMRNSRRCKDARVVVVSTSDSSGDREKMAALGAAGYFHKPSEYAEFMKLGDLVKSVLTPDSAS